MAGIATWKLLAILGLLAAFACAAPTGPGDHDDEHGGLLDDHSHHDGESKEMLRSKFKETKEKQGEIKANLSNLKNELRDLKNRLKAEKESGNTAKASELRALIKKKKKDFVAMKEEKKTAQRAKIDLKNQLKSAKAGNKENKEGGKGGKDKRKNKKNKKQDNEHRATKEDKKNKNKNKEAEKKQPEPQPPKKNRNKFSEHLDDDE